MDKYTVFDVDMVKTTVSAIQKVQKEWFYTISSDIESMIGFLKNQQLPNTQIHLTFKSVARQAVYMTP